VSLISYEQKVKGPSNTNPAQMLQTHDTT